METETVYYGDCLKLMREWNRQREEFYNIGQVDLIYLDPPFNSKANYNILFEKATGRTAQEIAFTDIWTWKGNKHAQQRVKEICNAIAHPAHKSISAMNMLIPESGMLAYLVYMADRIAQMKMLLKNTGCIYLHCDSSASHYLKMVMDDVFGHKNFRNEILWERTQSGKSSQHDPKSFGRNSDTILFYSKTKEYKLKPYKELEDDEIARLFPRINERGYRYAIRSLFRGKTLGPRPNLCYTWKGYKNPHPSGWMLSKERLEEEYQKGNIVVKRNGKLERRQYFEDSKGGYLSNLWCDIPPIPKKDRQGYPTEKPPALLERIIKASSNPGDIVLDPFCGCGTSALAAARLKRRFIGIDISLFAVETVTAGRLYNGKIGVKIRGIPEDFESAKRLAKDDPFGFQSWMIEACHPGMVANKVMRGDGGLDGTGMLLHKKTDGRKLVIAEVKAKKPTITEVRAFAETIQRKQAAAGVFITLDENGWTKGMDEICHNQGTFKTNADAATEFPIMQHWHVKKLENKHDTLPNLPELANPLNGKQLITKQRKLFQPEGLGLSSL